MPVLWFSGPQNGKEASVEKATLVGVDLAKNVFQVHGAAADGTVLFRKRLTRPQFHRFMADHPAAWWRWRRVVALTTGPAGCGSSAMTSG